MAASPKTMRILMAVYLAAVGILCFGNFSSTGLDVPGRLFGIPVDKVVHFVMFLPFVPLFYGSFCRDGRSFTVAFAGFLLAVAVGGAIEVLQGETGYRSRDVLDLLSDSLGALSGFAATTLTILLTRKTNHEKD